MGWSGLGFWITTDEDKKILQLLKNFFTLLVPTELSYLAE